MLSKCQNYLFLIIHAWTTHALSTSPLVWNFEELVLDELLCKGKSNLKSMYILASFRNQLKTSFSLGVQWLNLKKKGSHIFLFIH